MCRMLRKNPGKGLPVQKDRRKTGRSVNEVDEIGVVALAFLLPCSILLPKIRNSEACSSGDRIEVSNMYENIEKVVWAD